MVHIFWSLPKILFDEIDRREMHGTWSQLCWVSNLFSESRVCMYVRQGERERGDGSRGYRGGKSHEGDTKYSLGWKGRRRLFRLKLGRWWRGHDLPGSFYQAVHLGKNKHFYIVLDIWNCNQNNKFFASLKKFEPGPKFPNLSKNW